MTTLLRLPEVIKRTGLKRSSIYNAMADGTFPRQIRISGPSGRAVAWISDSVDQWIDERIQAAEKPAEVAA